MKSEAMEPVTQYLHDIYTLFTEEIDVKMNERVAEGWHLHSFNPMTSRGSTGMDSTYVLVLWVRTLIMTDDPVALGLAMPMSQ